MRSHGSASNRGREAVKKFLAHMHRNLEVTAFGPREEISEGNKAAAFGWFPACPVYRENRGCFRFDPV
jgi:hypothetical protein